MNIIVDIMGGDRPEEVVRGAIAAAKEHKNYRIIAVGDEALIKKVMTEEKADGILDVEHASDIILNEDVPTTAIKSKKDSSMVKGLSFLRGSEDNIGIISTGSTGALLTGATLFVGRIQGVYRPALVPLMPTINGSYVALADSGANVDSRPEYLLQFAIMASYYHKAVVGTENPRVALLNVGTEDKKGNALTQEAFALLKAAKNINFVGNMEARDANTGNYDVIIADGFAGNILVKSIEGTSMLMGKLLKDNIMSSKMAKFGYIFAKKAIDGLKGYMDYNNYGGAIFLGVKKIVVKAHGGTKAGSIYHSVKQVIKMHEADTLTMIEKGILEAGAIE